MATVRALRTAHGELPLPTFLPDATRGVVRGLDAADVEACGIRGLMLNAFHLSTHPGIRLIEHVGGAHAFVGWRGPIVTDSGGFQVFSLIRQNASFGTITRDGAIFRLAADDRRRNLTPEKAVQAQLQLGADVVTCLDDCTHPAAPPAEQAEAVERTIAWARRCRTEFDRLLAERGRRAPAGHSGDNGEAPARPLLFAVIQGGRDLALRRRCATELLEIGFDGYGFGGWPLDEQGTLLEEVLGYTAELVTPGTPLHALGVGKPESVVAGARLGYTLFDCALPTRDARHRRLYVFAAERPAEVDLTRPDFYRAVHVGDQRHRGERGPLAPGCDCLGCSRYSLAYLRHLYDVRDTLACRLGTIHNLRFYAQLLAMIRAEQAGAEQPPATPDNP